MALRLYDTMSREVREVFAMDGESVRFYCCGPTVYGPAHVGNFRTFVLQDVFRRTLETSGLKLIMPAISPMWTIKQFGNLRQKE